MNQLIWEVDRPDAKMTWVLFIAHIVFSSFYLMNMVVACLIDVFTKVQIEYRDEMCARTLAEALQGEFEEDDWEDHSSLSFSEFTALVKRGKLITILDNLHVDVPSFLELVESMYIVRETGLKKSASARATGSMVDLNAAVSIDDIVEVAMNLRTEAFARVKDFVEVRERDPKLKN